jgi:hypothetical protein
LILAGQLEPEATAGQLEPASLAGQLEVLEPEATGPTAACFVQDARLSLASIDRHLHTHTLSEKSGLGKYA